MSFVNGLLRAVVDAALFPFRDMAPIIGLTLFSLVAAVVILLVFKFTSNQSALESVKRRIHAGVFEIRLYNDDFATIMRAQLDILRANLTYLRHSMAPMVWTLPPLVLLIAQLQFHYGYGGLELGEPILLKVQLAEGAYSGDGKPAIEVDVPDGLSLETPAVWVESQSEMAWRLTAERAGDYELTIRNGGESATKTVLASDRIVRRSPFRVRGFFNELLYPAEPPLPAGGFEEITITYPEVDVDLLGFETHWMVWFFLLSIVFAFALRGPMGVTF